MKRKQVVIPVVILGVVLLWAVFLKPSRMSFLRGVSYDMASPELGVPSSMGSSAGFMGAATTSKSYNSIMPPMPVEDSVSLGTDRMSNQSRHIRAVVTKPREVVATLESAVVSMGGFVVHSNVSDTGEVGNASMSVRVPREKTNEFRSTIEGVVVKISSEDVNGQDITDQYTNYQARLSSLERSIAQFNAILDEAVEIKDILEVNQAIEQLQRQIDTLTGQMRHTEELSRSTLFTLTFSTDELELPLVPEDRWRPETIYRQSVREVIALYQTIGHSLIRIVVYAAVWIPVMIAVGILWMIGKKLGKRPTA